GRIYGDPQAMTWYSMGSSLIVYFMQFVTSITWAFTPFVTARWATGNMDDVRRVLHVGTRGVTILASLIAGGLILFGSAFLAFWQKPEYVSGELFVSAAVILQVLTVATLLRAVQSTGRQVLFAMREVRYVGLLVL